MKQENGESLAAFVLRLKQAETSCEYGTSLDRMLIEQMIFEIESQSIAYILTTIQPNIQLRLRTRIEPEELQQMPNATTRDKFKNAKCFSCGKFAHIGKVCKSRVKQISESIDGDDNEMVHFINHVGIVRTTGANAKNIITVNINGKDVDMELVTGALCSVMCIEKFKAPNGKLVLGRSERNLI
ncbi:LOW QUALITY PROTEIN: uncharacterized protein ACRADG_005314 [Cochliomyia hominivorax]